MANSPARASVDVGSVIADTYIIEALIGQGGMGSVFLASHNRLPGKRVAIKLLHVELHDDEVLARFRREATITSQLDHPNIVRVDDFNVHDGVPYLVLEYLEGESLAQRLKHGPLPLEQVLAIVRMVGSAIAAAHQLGYIHRDLKPQNLFLIPSELDGQASEVAKVLDFGISKMLNSTTVKTQESTLLGTPQYMAPEQATGQHASVDERTDVFALGTIVYEMLTGKPAFTGESIPEVVFKVVYEQPAPLAAAAPDAPPEVVAAVERAMQKRQDDRFPSVNAFVEALTGRPLVQRSSMPSLSPDRPRPGSATTGKRVGQAAFANTVDSGNVAKATVSPHAETVASQPGNERAPAAVPAPPRPRGLVIGLAIACAVAIAAVGYAIATRGAAREVAVASADAAVVTAPPVDAAVATIADPTADAAVVAAIDEVVATDDVPTDAAADVPTRDVPADASPPASRNKSGGKPVTVARDTGDPFAQEQLAKAEAALRAGNLDLAKILCNSVDNAPHASATQRGRALLLRGTIHCKRLDIGAAQTDLRMLERLGRTQDAKTLRARCKAAGQPLQ